MSVKWYADRFKNQLINGIVANGEIVGKFVETDARRRLMAIEQPDFGSFGKPYRQNVVARLLTSEVVVGDDEVVIYVGVAKSSSSDKHGLYIELGTRQDPAHPFLRPAVFENASKIVALLSGR